MPGIPMILLAAVLSIGVAHGDARKPHARGGHATFGQLTRAEQQKARQADASPEAFEAATEPRRRRVH